MNESDLQQVLLASKAVVAAGVKAPQTHSFQATRCFVLERRGVEEEGKVRRVVAADRHRELIESMRALRQASKWQRVTGIRVDADHAPRSEAAKKVEELAFKPKAKANGTNN
eukprot:9119148-Pyramimonas_sp.AAC.1